MPRRPPARGNPPARGGLSLGGQRLGGGLRLGGRLGRQVRLADERGSGEDVGELGPGAVPGLRLRQHRLRLRRHGIRLEGGAGLEGVEGVEGRYPRRSPARRRPRAQAPAMARRQAPPRALQRTRSPRTRPGSRSNRARSPAPTGVRSLGSGTGRTRRRSCQSPRGPRRRVIRSFTVAPPSSLPGRRCPVLRASCCSCVSAALAVACPELERTQSSCRPAPGSRP